MRPRYTWSWCPRQLSPSRPGARSRQDETTPRLGNVFTAAGPAREAPEQEILQDCSRLLSRRRELLWWIFAGGEGWQSVWMSSEPGEWTHLDVTVQHAPATARRDGLVSSNTRRPWGRWPVVLSFASTARRSAPSPRARALRTGRPPTNTFTLSVHSDSAVADHQRRSTRPGPLAGGVSVGVVDVRASDEVGMSRI